MFNMMMRMMVRSSLVAVAIATLSAGAQADVVAKKVKTSLPAAAYGEEVWANAPTETLTLIAQPAAVPMPKETTTSEIKVQAVHDGKYIAFRMKWADTEASQGGKLGEFSDAVAMQFPVKKNEAPPAIMMGSKDDPAHIFHWRYQYQHDAEKGMKTVKDIYPNSLPDMYPLEFAHSGSVKDLNDEKRMVFSHGKAAGNPQSFPKTGVDEIMAEGFGTSAVIEKADSQGKGVWKDGAWSVVIVRALARSGGSTLVPGKPANVAFAVWQGGKDEVGSRKSLTMDWAPLKIEE
jgi:hypothetical protein